MFAAGYQMATDRLFQMDLVRRRALGRQAEVLGPDSVGQDEVSRMFEFRRWGAANAERLRAEDPDRYRMLVAWVAGVNRRIAEVAEGSAPLPYGFGPAELDYQPEPWTVEEHSAIAKMLFFGNSNSLERELLATILQRNFADTWEILEIARPAFATATMPEEERPPASADRGLRAPQRARPPIRSVSGGVEEVASAVADQDPWPGFREASTSAQPTPFRLRFREAPRPAPRPASPHARHRRPIPRRRFQCSH